MIHKSFEDMGIPRGYGFKQLLFCLSAKKLVVHTESVRPWRPERLYIRDLSSDRYTLVGSPADMISQQYPVISNSKCLLAYSAELNKFDVNEEGDELHFGQWDSINIHNLAAPAEARILDSNAIRFPEGVNDGWISSILSFSDSGKNLNVVAGLSRTKRRHMEYYVCDLDLETGVLRPITILPATFM